MQSNLFRNQLTYPKKECKGEEVIYLYFTKAKAIPSKVVKLKLRATACAFLFYQALLTTTLKRKEKIYNLTSPSFELPPKNDALRTLKFDSSCVCGDSSSIGLAL